jgi:hypothetical protein
MSFVLQLTHLGCFPNPGWTGNASLANAPRQTTPADSRRKRKRLCLRNRNSANLDTMNTNHDQSPFGEVIYTYTLAHAIADGWQIDVTKTAQEARIRFPVFLTRAVYDAYVTVPPGVEGQDEAGRLWDLIWMLRFAIRRARPGVKRIPVAFYVRNDNRPPRLVKLIATCGALDVDNSQPAITIEMPGDD